MEEKNFDLKSFIGFILIGAILLYMMYQNQPLPNNTTSATQTDKEEVINTNPKENLQQTSVNLNNPVKKTRAFRINSHHLHYH